jgi:hypothetical protein
MWLLILIILGLLWIAVCLPTFLVYLRRWLVRLIALLIWLICLLLGWLVWLLVGAVVLG